jgi:hypothetical protein
LNPARRWATRHNQRIAGSVAHRVVDVLEAVDVDVCDHNTAVVALLDQRIELILQACSTKW